MQNGSKKPSSERSRLVRAIVLLVALIIGITVVWFVFTAALGTSTPFFVVSSGSMVPNLNVGDVIIVKDSGTFDTLVKGEVIVFHRPLIGNIVIVHRVYDIFQDSSGKGITTKGDHNPAPDGWIVRRSDYIGKVVFSVPQIGVVAGWLTPPYNYILIAVLIILIFFTEFRGESKKEIEASNRS